MVHWGKKIKIQPLFKNLRFCILMAYQFLGEVTLMVFKCFTFAFKHPSLDLFLVCFHFRPLYFREFHKNKFSLDFVSSNSCKTLFWYRLNLGIWENLLKSLKLSYAKTKRSKVYFHCLQPRCSCDVVLIRFFQFAWTEWYLETF